LKLIIDFLGIFFKLYKIYLKYYYYTLSIVLCFNHGLSL